NTLYAYYSDQCSFHSHILTGTQSNETEASCSRLAPSSEYGFQSLKKKMSLLQVRLSLNVGHLFINQLLTNFTNEVKSKIRPVTTEAYW
ncbi:hypothetical protein KSF78_0009471, partial [Schistosoma japonicum]